VTILYNGHDEFRTRDITVVEWHDVQLCAYFFQGDVRVMM